MTLAQIDTPKAGDHSPQPEPPAVVNGRHSHGRTGWIHIGLTGAAITAVLVLCGLRGTLLWQPGQYPWHEAKLAVYTAGQLPKAQSASLSSDLPSLLLALSAACSMFLFVALFDRLRTLPSDMARSGLIDEGVDAESEFDRFRCPLAWWEHVLVWIGSIGLGITFYVLVTKMRIYPATWWVLDPHSPADHYALVALWIFIGSEGLYTATAQMWTSLRVVSTFENLRACSQDASKRFEFHYLEPWQRPSQGWDCAWPLIRNKIAGLLVSLPAFAALYLVFMQKEATRPLAILITLLVAGVSVRQLAILTLIPRIYEDSVGREIGRNNNDLATADSEELRAANARRDSHLTAMLNNQRGYTLLAGRVATAVTLATGIAGVIVPAVT